MKWEDIYNSLKLKTTLASMVQGFPQSEDPRRRAVFSAGDMRRVITRKRHHTPKRKLRCRINNMPRTMYRYKSTLSGVQITLLDHTPCSFKECDFPHTSAIFQTTSTVFYPSATLTK